MYWHRYWELEENCLKRQKRDRLYEIMPLGCWELFTWSVLDGFLSGDAECWAGTCLCCRKAKFTSSLFLMGLSIPISLFSSVASILLYLPYLHYLPSSNSQTYFLSCWYLIYNLSFLLFHMTMNNQAVAWAAIVCRADGGFTPLLEQHRTAWRGWKWEQQKLKCLKN